MTKNAFLTVYFPFNFLSVILWVLHYEDENFQNYYMNLKKKILSENLIFFSWISFSFVLQGFNNELPRTANKKGGYYKETLLVSCTTSEKFVSKSEAMIFV